MCTCNELESLKVLPEQPTGANGLVLDSFHSVFPVELGHLNQSFESKLFYCEKRATLLLILGETEYKNTERKHKKKSVIFLYFSLFTCNYIGSIDIIHR